MNGAADWLVMAALMSWFVALGCAVLVAAQGLLAPRAGRARLTLRQVLRAPAILLAHWLAPYLSLQSRLAISARLQRAGFALQCTASRWVAWKMLAMAALLLVTAVAWAGGAMPAALMAAALAGWWLPELWLRNAIRQRARALDRALPVSLDQLILITGCGHNAETALSLMREWSAAGWPCRLLQELQHQLQRHAMAHAMAHALPARWRHWMLPAGWQALIAQLEPVDAPAILNARLQALEPMSPS